MSQDPGGPLADPVAFVGEAERMTNEREVEGIRHIFGREGRWTTVIDGLETHAEGPDEIVARWGVLRRFMARRELFVSKQLVAASEHTIVNRWHGRAGGPPAIGVEVWQFDADGLVTDQLLLGSLNPRPETSPPALLGLAISQPRDAVAFVRTRFGGA